MKLLGVWVLLLFLSNNPGQYVKGKGYEGYIFNKEHFVWMKIPDQKCRYTPSIKDVEIAEKLLKQQLFGLNKFKINQGGQCPDIYKKLKRYKRQYVGFVNNNQEIILWVNLIYGKIDSEKLSGDIIHGLDGCSHYWNIKINISTNEVYDLDVNGSA